MGGIVSQSSLNIRRINSAFELAKETWLKDVIESKGFERLNRPLKGRYRLAYATARPVANTLIYTAEIIYFN